MANLTTASVTRAGVALDTVSAAAGGDTFTPGDYVFIYVYNLGGGSITVTVPTPRTTDGLAVADVAVSIPATTGERFIGPFPAEHFADPTDGLADLQYSGVTSVFVGVFALQQP